MTERISIEVECSNSLEMIVGDRRFSIVREDGDLDDADFSFFNWLQEKLRQHEGILFPY